MKILFIVTLLASCWLPMIALADECIEGNCVNGKGTLLFSTGHKYTGEFENGEFVGN